MRRGLQLRFCLLLIAAVFVAGCGDSGDTAPQPPAATIASTRAVAIPTFSFTQPTVAPQVATAAATLVSGSATVEFDAEAAERGRGRYEALGCADCHGANGEGSDEGSPLLDYEGTKDDFITLMRSGGPMGPEHQYASNRLSETGANNIFQFLMSLQQ